MDLSVVLFSRQLRPQREQKKTKHSNIFIWFIHKENCIIYMLTLLQLQFSPANNYHLTFLPSLKSQLRGRDSASLLSVLHCARWVNWKRLIDGFSVDCLSTSVTDETCQRKDTWMQQPILHFLLLLPRQRQEEWRSKYRCTMHHNSGAHCLLSAVTASAAVEIKHPGARKKLVFPLINCQAKQSRKRGTQFCSAPARLG